MANVLPMAFSILALIPAGQDRGDQSLWSGLPLKYVADGKVIEVPLNGGELGWRPNPSRIISSKMLEPPEQERDEELDEMDLPRLVPKVKAIGFNDYYFKSGSFDLWLFGDLSEQKKRAWLLSALTARILDARNLGLSAVEEDKLILAGRGDIKRFFDRVGEKQVEFEVLRKDYAACGSFLRSLDMRSLMVEFDLGPFGEDSFFAKTLRKIENDRHKKPFPIPAKNNSKKAEERLNDRLIRGPKVPR